MDPSLLWSWCRPASTALIGILAWEPPYVMGVALIRKQERKKRKEKRKEKKRKRKKERKKERKKRTKRKERTKRKKGEQS